MAGRLRTSRPGLDLIKSFEGFRDSAARLPDGRWIIGFGHVRTAREGLVISEQDAEDLLVHDLKPAEDAVGTLVYAPLAQNQFDALVSLAFNISPGQFKDSDILRALNVGDFIAAANGFDAWRRARINGRLIVVDALVRRRTVEKAMFLEHAGGRPSAPTPLVTPELDPGHLEPSPRRAPDETRTPITHPAAANEDAANEVDEVTSAVQRLAERTSRTEKAPAVSPPPIAAPEAPKPATVEEARRAVAERLSKILERTEKTIAVSQAAQARSEPVQAMKPVTQLKPEPTPAPVVIDEMPDFDAPLRATAAPAETGAKRKVIDDTETYDPGRDPSEIFAEAVRAEKKVNGVAGRSVLNGSAGRFLPWIALMILSGLGLAIGLTELFRPSAEGSSSVQVAGTVFAVFGLLLVTSIYFIASRARDGDAN